MRSGHVKNLFGRREARVARFPTRGAASSIISVSNKHELAERLRDALEPRAQAREVKMFGGLSFMVNDKIALGTMSDGSLLVRADPKRDDLLDVKGARQAEMGKGRAMGKGWITVTYEGIATEEDLDFWVGVALEYNAGAA